MKGIYEHFRMSIAYLEWAQSSSEEKAKIETAFTSRCKAQGLSYAVERNGGVRRIDYSKGKGPDKGRESEYLQIAFE